MSTADTYVRARIDTVTKERAADALEAMGLSISDAIRMLMFRIADEHCLPFEVKVPSKSSRKALGRNCGGESEDLRHGRRLDGGLECGRLIHPDHSSATSSA